MGIGGFGGTFDPIHRGHLELAQAALIELSLDRIIFIPASQPWLKEGQPLTPACHRLAMVRLAVEEIPAFSVSAMEIDRSGPTYSVDTLEALRQEVGEDEDLFLILGSDVLEQFHRWKDPERILELCRLAVANRAGADGSQISRFLDRFPNAAGKMVILDANLPEISSTGLRDAMAGGKPAGSMIPERVVSYIQQYGLYAWKNKMNSEDRLGHA